MDFIPKVCHFPAHNPFKLSLSCPLRQSLPSSGGPPPPLASSLAASCLCPQGPVAPVLAVPGGLPHCHRRSTHRARCLGETRRAASTRLRCGISGPLTLSKRLQGLHRGLSTEPSFRADPVSSNKLKGESAPRHANLRVTRHHHAGRHGACAGLPGGGVGGTWLMPGLRAHRWVMGQVAGRGHDPQVPQERWGSPGCRRAGRGAWQRLRGLDWP